MNFLNIYVAYIINKFDSMTQKTAWSIHFLSVYERFLFKNKVEWEFAEHINSIKPTYSRTLYLKLWETYSMRKTKTEYYTIKWSILYFLSTVNRIIYYWWTAVDTQKRYEAMVSINLLFIIIIREYIDTGTETISHL